MAELGETSDPVALVPGSPDGVDGVAGTFTTESERLDAIGRELNVFDLPRWGGNASEQFREIFSPVPTRWFKTSDALVAAAGALTSYAETLRWAQGQAGEAIAQWAEGEAATTSALAGHQTALAEAEAADRPAPTFTDPGEELRQQARETLTRARTQLDEAGCTAAHVLTGNGPQGTDVSTYLTDVLVGDTPLDRGRGGRSLDEDWEVTGARGTASPESGPGIRIGSVSSGDEDGIGFGAGAEGSASVDRSGAHATAEVTLGATAEGELREDYGAIEFTHEGSVLAGGRAEGTIDLGANGLSAEAEAFAGGRAEYGLGAEAGGIGASGGVEAWAGAGASANAELSYENGRFTIDLDAGAALGIGGGINAEVTLDPGEVAENIGDEAEILDRNTDVVTANDNHQDGLLNTMERGFRAIGDRIPGL